MDRQTKIFSLFLDGRTYDAIAKQLGISRQRVQQIVRPPKAIYDSVRGRAKNKCEVCGIHTQGHVHHRHSKGRTIDNFNELKFLVYVCPTCHRQAHGAQPTPRNKSFIVKVTQQEHIAFSQLAIERHTNLSELSRQLLRRMTPAATLGRKGGIATLRKYGRKQMREWGKRGGRPRKEHP